MRISFSFIGDSGLGFSTFWYLSMEVLLQGGKRKREDEDEEEDRNPNGKEEKAWQWSVWECDSELKERGRGKETKSLKPH